MFEEKQNTKNPFYSFKIEFKDFEKKNKMFVSPPPPPIPIPS